MIGFGFGEFVGYAGKGIARGIANSGFGQDAGRLANNIALSHASMLMGGMPIGGNIDNGTTRTILELFSGPIPQINRSIPGYRTGEARIIPVDLKTYGSRQIVQGDATNLTLFDDDSIDEIFITNPWIRSVRDEGIDAVRSFKLSVYGEVARVLRPGGRVIISGTPSNSFALVGDIQKDLRRLGFDINTNQGSPYGNLHPALHGQEFYRMGMGEDGGIIPASEVRSAIVWWRP